MQELGDLLATRDITAIIGAAHPDSEEVCTVLNKFRDHGKFLIDAPCMAKYMADANTAFTAGVATCHELAAMGIAQFAVTLEARQRDFF